MSYTLLDGQGHYLGPEWKVRPTRATGRTIRVQDGPSSWVVPVPVDVPDDVRDGGTLLAFFYVPGGSHSTAWGGALSCENVRLIDFHGFLAVSVLDPARPAWAWSWTVHPRTGSGEQDVAYCPVHIMAAPSLSPECPHCAHNRESIRNAQEVKNYVSSRQR